MKGFIAMDIFDDTWESIALTLCKTKEHMDSFYQTDNRALSELVEKLKPSFERLLQRKDYQVSDFKLSA